MSDPELARRCWRPAGTGVSSGRCLPRAGPESALGGGVGGGGRLIGAALCPSEGLGFPACVTGGRQEAWNRECGLWGQPGWGQRGGPRLLVSPVVHEGPASLSPSPRGASQASSSSSRLTRRLRPLGWEGSQAWRRGRGRGNSEQGGVEPTVLRPRPSRRSGRCCGRGQRLSLCAPPAPGGVAPPRGGAGGAGRPGPGSPPPRVGR